jgi:dienelactone hydrolase
MLTGIGLLLVAVAAAAEDYTASMATLTCQGKSVPVEWYVPLAEGPRPLLVILHGSGGLPPPDTPDWMHAFARAFAEDGYIVLVPRFAEVAGTSTGPSNGKGKSKGKGKSRRGVPDFNETLKILEDMIDQAAERPNVDPRRIGVLGYSMGANLALCLAMREPRVQAIALYSGGHPGLALAHPEKIPPTLILLGDADPSIRTEDARRLAGLLKDQETPHDIHIYPRMGHGWAEHRLVDAGARTSTFFARYVAGARARDRDRGEPPARNREPKAAARRAPQD